MKVKSLTTFTPNKLSINYIKPANSKFPVVGRKYTLTHSDLTGQLFLDIGSKYNFSSIDPKMRDEVLAEWKTNQDGLLILFGRVLVDNGEYSVEEANERFKIFQKEMALALKGIVNGDLSFYSHYPSLLSAPIFIYYHSKFPSYNGVYHYGTTRDYLK